MNEETLFHLALQKPAHARAAFLAEACAGDAAVRKRIEVLLRAHENRGNPLDKPPVDPALTADSNEPNLAPDPTSGFIGANSVATWIGPYKLLQTLGEGGMGTVYLAEQEQPVKRRVALKIIKAGMDSAQIIARFEQERQALAVMDHPNIAKVLEAATTDTGRPYFVMELVLGIPVTKYCDQEHLTPKERLELFIPICQAVQHAHQKGIIHRDLKPSNVLIALYDGKPIAKVIDFGVAKATAQKLTERTMFTEVGQIVGTLEYMAPEQAELTNLDIDTRADIYSLGVILYELLTGSPPFTSKQLRGAAFTEMLRMIREVEPPKPSTKLSSSDELPSIAANRKLEPKKLTTLVHGELDWIVMKCLEKERSRRYDTANGLGMELQRYLADEPVLAGPPSAGYRLRKFIRRNRGPVLAASLLMLALVGGVAVSSWQAIRVADERDQKVEALGKAHEATKAERTATQIAQTANHNEAIARRAAELTVADMDATLGFQASERRQNHTAVLWFATSAAHAAIHDKERASVNRIRASNWRRDCFLPTRVLSIGKRLLDRIAFHPQDQHLLALRSPVFGGGDEALLWELEGGQAVPLPGGNRPISSAAWSPDGRRLALGESKGGVEIYSFPEGVRIERLDVSTRVQLLAYSPDGRFLAFASVGKVRVWDSEQHKYALPVLMHPRQVEVLEFNRRGSVLAVGDGVQAWLYDVETANAPGKPLFPPVSHKFSRNGGVANSGRAIAPLFIEQDRVVLTLETGQRITWRDSTTGVVIHEAQRPKGAEEAVRALKASPDGRHFVACWYGAAQLWSVAARAPVGSLLKHGNQVFSAAFFPDSQQLLTISGDNTAKLWSVPESNLLATLPHQSTTYLTAISGNGLHVATMQEDGPLRIWRAPEGPPGHYQIRLDGRFARIALRPDGVIGLPFGSTSGLSNLRTSYVFDVATGTRRGPKLDAGGNLLEGAFAPQGRHVALLQAAAPRNPAKGSLRVWDWEQGRPLFDSQPMPSEPHSLAYSPDGKLLAVLCHGQQILLLNPQTGAVVREIHYAGAPRGPGQNAYHIIANGMLAFSPDGKSLVTWSMDNMVKVWDPATGELRFPPLPHDRYCYGIAFSPNGQLLATASLDRKVRLWNFATGQPTDVTLSHPDEVFTVRFSGDGKSVVTACRDGAARVWNLETRELACPPLLHDNEVWDAAFLDGGRWIVTASADQTGRLWDAQTGMPITPPLRLGGRALNLALAPDGKRVLIGSNNATVDCFRVDEMTHCQEEPLENLLLCAELVAAARVEAGALVRLTTQEWLLRWEKWSHQEQARAGQPRRADFAKSDAAAYQRLGDTLQKNEDWDGAIAAYRQAVALDSKNVVAHLNLIYALHNKKDWDGANACCHKAIGANPEDARLRNHLGWGLFNKRDFNGAIVAYREAIRLDPKFVLAHYNLGWVLGTSGDFAGSASVLQNAIELAPDDAHYQYVLGAVHMALGDRDAHRKVCANMLQRFGRTNNPGVADRVLYACVVTPDALDDMAHLLPLAELAATNKAHTRVLGASLYRAGKYEAAIPKLEQGQARAWDYLFLAMAHHRLGHKEKAREYLGRAVVKIATANYPWSESTESTQLCREAEALLGTARHDLTATTAVDAYRRYLQRNPNDAWAHHQLSVALLNEGKHDEAIAAWQKANELSPSASGHLKLAYFRLTKGEAKAAAEESGKAVAVRPGDIDVRYEHGAFLLLASDAKGFRQFCARTMDRFGQTTDPKVAHQVARLCNLAATDGAEAARALRLVDMAAAKQRTSWRVHTLGLAQYRSGQFDQAIKTLEESLTIDPNWQGAFCNWLALAMANHRLGRTQNAAQWLDKAAKWMDLKSLKPGKEYLGPMNGISEFDWLEGRVLRREAEALIKGAGQDPTESKQ